ncbi:hypothetical protein PINS_up005290 [Pythium insidiosum]|nr:hypothetical protein PINS_up005290 [Pythium insidiosum]
METLLTLAPFEVLVDALAWPTVVLHMAVALWIVLLLLSLRMWSLQIREGLRIMSTPQTLSWCKKSKSRWRRGKRVDVQPAPAPASQPSPSAPSAATSSASMRVRYVRLSPCVLSCEKPQEPTSPSPSPSPSPLLSRSGAGVDVARDSRTQPNGCNSRLRVSTPSSDPPTRTARATWRCSGAASALLFMVGLLLLTVSQATVATAEAVADSIPFPTVMTSEWYIVLVSIPVLDKVLPLKSLAEELLHRGYRVGFALPENCRQWVSDLDQLEFISLGNIAGKGRGTYQEFSELETIGVYESYAATLRYYASFQRPMFSALMDDFEDDRPDLVVIDRYTFAGFDACHALQLPYVVNSPSMLMDIDSPPAHIPAPFSNYTMHTASVLERCLNGLHRLRFRLSMVQVFKDINTVRREHGLPAIQTKEDLFGQQLVLVNSIFGLDEARPIAPQFQMIGMLDSHADSSKELPDMFERWLSSDLLNRALIFISFPADTPLTPDMVSNLMNGLEEIGARLIWRIKLQEQAAFDLRSRTHSSVFFLSEDVDESLVLASAPVALLITPGNVHSIHNALRIGVPILGLPFSAEQWEHVNAVVRVGAGQMLQASTFSESRVRDAAFHLLTKPSFATNSFYVGELLKTGGGAARAADQVASAVEFGVAHVLPARNVQPLYKTFLVDVYVIYGIILCASAVILRTFFSVLYAIFQIAPDVHLGVTLDDVDDPELHSPQPHGHHQPHGAKEKSI